VATGPAKVKAHPGEGGGAERQQMEKRGQKLFGVGKVEKDCAREKGMIVTRVSGRNNNWKKEESGPRVTSYMNPLTGRSP